MYNKEEVMKAWREEWHIKLVSLAQELTPYPELEEKMFQFWEEKVSTALDSAFKAGREKCKKEAGEACKNAFRNYKEEHLCRFNDGEQNCNCYLSGINEVIVALEVLK